MIHRDVFRWSDYLSRYGSNDKPIRIQLIATGTEMRSAWIGGKYSDTLFRPGTAFIQPIILADWTRADEKPTGTM